MKLWQKVMLGLILGVLCGMFFPSFTIKTKFLGELFMKGIKMVITPVIFFSLSSGITGMRDTDSLGRVSMKAVLSFLLTSLFAVLFGLAIGTLFQPGEGVNLELPTSYDDKNVEQFDIITFLLNIVPSNPVQAILDQNVLQIVFLAVFLGISINKMTSESFHVKKFLNLGAKVSINMISIIMEFAPLGAFSLIGFVVANQGIEVLYSLSSYVVCVLLAIFLQYLIFGIFIIVFCRISPWPFYKKSFEYQSVAFATSSSKATLPTTMKICEEKLGISKTGASFILPLGAAINMDGIAINLAISVLFIAQILGVHLNLEQYIVIILTTTICSIGGAGIPGATLIMLPMVLSAVQLPMSGVLIVAGIDRFLDIFRTMLSITGDAAITLIIDHSEGTLDKKTYYQK